MIIASQKPRIKKSRIIVGIVLFIGAAASLVPFFWMIRSSFMNMLEIYIIPPLLWSKSTSLENYATVFLAEIPFLRYFFNTILIVIPVIFGTVLSSSIVAYGFSRFVFPFRQGWFAICISSMLIPSAVTLIPGFLVWKTFGAVNTYYPLILPSFFGGGAFNIFLFRQFFMTIPKSLDEAARIDGAGTLRIYAQILMPQLKPVIIVVMLFTFMNTWNDFFGPMLYLYDTDKYTVALGLQLFSSSYGADYGAIMAGATVMTLPTIVIFFIGQKYFVQGIVATGLKG